MTKTRTFYWTSNKYDTQHTLKIYEGGKLLATMPKIDSETLRAAVKELKAAGYIHK